MAKRPSVSDLGRNPQTVFPRGFPLYSPLSGRRGSPLLDIPVNSSYLHALKESIADLVGVTGGLAVAPPGPRTLSGRYHDLRMDLPKEQIIVPSLGPRKATLRSIGL